MSDFWATDKPTNVDEAIELLRFGAIQTHTDDEYPEAIARTERRMANSARLLEETIAALRAEVEALKHDIERATQRNSDLLAENENLSSARWLTEAHLLCTDMDIPQGHIFKRMVALRSVVEALKVDAERLDCLQSRMLAIDFDYGEKHEHALVFKWGDSPVMANLRMTIDAARKESANG